MLEGYEEDESKDDFHSVIITLLSAGPEVLKAAEPDVFSYYQDMNGYWAPGLPPLRWTFLTYDWTSPTPVDISDL